MRFHNKRNSQPKQGRRKKEIPIPKKNKVHLLFACEFQEYQRMNDNDLKIAVKQNKLNPQQEMEKKTTTTMTMTIMA